MPGVSAGSVGVDPAYWRTHELSREYLSPGTLHPSPGGNSSAHDSAQSITSTAQTPQTDNSRKNSSVENGQQNGQKSKQAAADASQRASVAVACVPCRSRHLKCDGGVRCSRCRADGVDCTYIKSRRGWKGKRKTKREDQISPVAINGAQVPQIPISNGHMVSNGTMVTTGQLQSPNSYYNGEAPIMNQLSPTNGLGVQSMPPPAAPQQLNMNGTARVNRFGHLGPETAIQSFFHYFYNSHPFCLPEPRLLEVFNQRKAPLLEYAVQYLGSSYLSAMPTEMYKEALNRNINSGNYARDGWSVQALLLYAIGLHANNEVPRAAQIFAAAQDLTLEVGLNRMEYALIHGESDPQFEESWRRTWWSMYTANGMLCAVNPGVQFKLKDILTDVPLPCENDQYLSGHIPYPATLVDYDDSAFMPTLPVYSSFTYLIDAIRILGKVFECARLDSTFEYHAVDVVDQYLCNWRLHLPASKLDIVNNDGVVDEVLFQAHMVNAGSTIMLHRPRSNLGFGRVEGVNICVQPGQVLLPTQTREIHTAKCLTSAENISSLIRLPGQLLHHTPFFTCVVVMASVVHLSYWSFLVPDGQDDIVKQSIRLDVGALQQYSNTWPIANVVLGQVRGVAHTLFNSKKAMSIHLWSNIAQGDVIRDVIEDGGNVPPQQYAQLIAP
ncbi:DNA binding [Ascochyta rabiei]|uniref:DNA binding n=2 Tax=Didymella rabiei TaxID=5454 RepID=A0A162WJT6_DIDRA|nr:DNA binding [Ascochyta rabiei]